MKKLFLIAVLTAGGYCIAGAQTSPRSSVYAHFSQGTIKYTADDVVINGNGVTMSGNIVTESGAGAGIGVGAGAANPGQGGNNPPGHRLPFPIVVTIPGYPVLGTGDGGNLTLDCLPGNHCITGVIFVKY